MIQKLNHLMRSSKLLTAETAKMTKVATAATGSGKIQTEGSKVAAVKHFVKERRGISSRKPNNRTPHSSSESYSSNRSSGSLGGGGQSDGSGSDSRRNSGGSADFRRNSGEPPGTNFLCHYCKERSHYGGWKLCEKRRKENPDWTLPTKDF